MNPFVNGMIDSTKGFKLKIDKMKKLVLAYSGGLDTSYCAKYLSEVENYEVHAVSVNTGNCAAAAVHARWRWAGPSWMPTPGAPIGRAAAPSFNQ